MTEDIHHLLDDDPPPDHDHRHLTNNTIYHPHLDSSSSSTTSTPIMDEGRGGGGFDHSMIQNFGNMTRDEQVIPPDSPLLNPHTLLLTQIQEGIIPSKEEVLQILEENRPPPLLDHPSSTSSSNSSNSSPHLSNTDSPTNPTSSSSGNPPPTQRRSTRSAKKLQEKEEKENIKRQTMLEEQAKLDPEEQRRLVNAQRGVNERIEFLAHHEDMPDLSQYDLTDIKDQIKAENNLEAVTNRNHEMKQLEWMIENLELENNHLKSRLREEGEYRQERDRKVELEKTKKLEEMISKANEKKVDDVALNQYLRNFSDQFWDLGKENLEMIDFHLDWISRLIMPIQTTKCAIWVTEAAAEFYYPDGSRMTSDQRVKKRRDTKAANNQNTSSSSSSNNNNKDDSNINEEENESIENEKFLDSTSSSSIGNESLHQPPTKRNRRCESFDMILGNPNSSMIPLMNSLVMMNASSTPPQSPSSSRRPSVGSFDSTSFSSTFLGGIINSNSSPSRNIKEDQNQNQNIPSEESNSQQEEEEESGSLISSTSFGSGSVNTIIKEDDDHLHFLAGSIVDDVINELQLNKEQRRQILKLREEFKFLHFNQVKLIQQFIQFRELALTKYSLLNDEIEKVRSYLNPMQIGKFIIWIYNNEEAMVELDKSLTVPLPPDHPSSSSSSSSTSSHQLQSPPHQQEKHHLYHPPLYAPSPQNTDEEGEDL